ncbi:hypothetical protein [Thiobacter aerophilum]|uniref:Uncharacterized protein n=1 Tax=Thiobacter aerophilum TaxID=3121275 RepID=A0ABV0EBN5_9BURK
MLIVKDMGSGTIEEWIGPDDETFADDYDAALSSGWDPVMAEVIKRERDHYEISQAETPMPADLNDVDIDAFLDRMYTYMG